MALHLLAALLLPFAAAPLAAGVGRRAAVGIAFVAALGQAGLALLAAPDDAFRFGGVIVTVGPFTRLLLPIFLGVMVSASAFGEEHSPHFVPVALLVEGCAAGVVLVDSPFLGSLFLEMAGILSLFLVPRRPQDPAVGLSGAKFLTATVVSATVLLAAFGLIETYRVGGQNQTLAQTVIVLLIIGTGIRLAAFPFHLWLPGFAQSAPPSTVLLVCGIVNIGALALLVSVFATSPWLLQDDRTRLTLAEGSALGALCAAIIASFQTDLRRLMAYATVCDIGFSSMAIAMASVGTLAAGVVLVFAHATVLILMWLTIDQIEARTGSTIIGTVRGLGSQLPVTGIGFLFGGLCFGGVPLVATFSGRWVMYQQAAQLGNVWVLALVGASGLLLMTFLRAYDAFFLGHPTEGLLRPESRSTNTAIVVLVAGSLAMGLYSSRILAGVGDMLAASPFLNVR